MKRRPITRNDLRKGLGSLPPRSNKHVDPRTPEETAHMTPVAVAFSNPNKGFIDKLIDFVGGIVMFVTMIVLFQWGEAFRVFAKDEGLGYEGNRTGRAAQQVLDHNPIYPRSNPPA